MSVLYTDHGKSDFSPRFTEMLAGYNIQHAGDIPRRSESQGAAELANKLLQNQLARICSSENGRKAWEKSLPRAVQCLNQYHPYGSALSRCQLLFSPFIHLALGGVRGLSNPLSMQRFTYKQLNDRRVRGLLDKRAGTKLYNFVPGQYVTMNESPEQGDSHKLLIPGNSQLYRVIETHGAKCQERGKTNNSRC